MASSTERPIPLYQCPVCQGWQRSNPISPHSNAKTGEPCLYVGAPTHAALGQPDDPRFAGTGA